MSYWPHQKGTGRPITEDELADAYESGVDMTREWVYVPPGWKPKLDEAGQWPSPHAIVRVSP